MSVRILLFFICLSVVTSLACTKPYYARSFEENQIRRVAEQAENFHRQCQEVEQQIAKDNDDLKGTIAQMSYTNTQAQNEAKAARSQLEKLKVSNLGAVPIMKAAKKSTHSDDSMRLELQ